MARVAGVCDERILLLIHCLLAAERAPPALMNLTPRAIFPGVFSPEPETAEAGKGLGLSLIILKRFGAEEGTRTPTPLRVRGPEPRASANSATSALYTTWQRSLRKCFPAPILVTLIFPKSVPP